MPDPIGASPDSTVWTAISPVSSAAPGTPWTRGTRVAIVVGPVYFLYGGASVWTLVR
jgi:hypothetical protein